MTLMLRTEVMAAFKQAFRHFNGPLKVSIYIYHSVLNLVISSHFIVLVNNSMMKITDASQRSLEVLGKILARQYKRRQQVVLHSVSSGSQALKIQRRRHARMLEPATMTLLLNAPISIFSSVTK